MNDQMQSQKLIGNSANSTGIDKNNLIDNRIKGQTTNKRPMSSFSYYQKDIFNSLINQTLKH